MVRTLDQTLTQLGFSPEQALDGIRSLLRRESSELEIVEAGKDSIWGLNECLDWLALTYESSQLPNYEVKNSPLRKALQVRNVPVQMPQAIGMLKSYTLRPLLKPALTTTFRGL